jgi:pimeloyl-ACP methyl ester carboxylesterase
MHTIKSTHLTRLSGTQGRFNRDARLFPKVAPSRHRIQATTQKLYSEYHTLPDGMKLEYLHQPPISSPTAPSFSRPTLIFIHGSFHGAWCWEKYFLPFFAQHGYDCYALSLRGQGNSDRGNLKVAGTLDSHAADVSSFLSSILLQPSSSSSSSSTCPPVLIGHSFGGLLVAKYAVLQAQQQQWNNNSSNNNDGDSNDKAALLSGAAFLCSVPHVGNAGIIKRITQKSIWNSIRITWGFIGKSFIKNIDDCRWLFFSEGLPVFELQEYQLQLAACSPVRLLDLAALNKELPLQWPDNNSKNGSMLPCFVGGGEADIVVDVPAVKELAEWVGVKPVIWKGIPHDCMLDVEWKVVANDLKKWLDEL